MSKEEGLIEALVCKRCGVLCPTNDRFMLGIVVEHHAGPRMATHKLEIKMVDGKSKMVDSFSWLVAEMWVKKLFNKDLYKVEREGEKEKDINNNEDIAWHPRRSVMRKVKSL